MIDFVHQRLGPPFPSADNYRAAASEPSHCGELLNGFLDRFWRRVVLFQGSKKRFCNANTSVVLSRILTCCPRQRTSQRFALKQHDSQMYLGPEVCHRIICNILNNQIEPRSTCGLQDFNKALSHVAASIFAPPVHGDRDGAPLSPPFSLALQTSYHPSLHFNQP
jgi:hypothetical protein